MRSQFVAPVRRGRISHGDIRRIRPVIVGSSSGGDREVPLPRNGSAAHGATDDASRVALVLLARFVAWRELLTIVRPDTFVRASRYSTSTARAT